MATYDYNRAGTGMAPQGYQRKVTFAEAIKMGFSNYVNFSGRSSRSEYWFWTLFAVIVGAVTAIIDEALGLGTDDVGVISTIVSLVFVLPGLALTVRRLHDIGKGGGWVFIAFVPIVGAIVLLIFALQESQMEPNRFGDIPNMVN